MYGEPEKIAIYGKGGIGKSVIAGNLSAYYATQGNKVLHIGCDPKADSVRKLVGSDQEIWTVLQLIGRDGDTLSLANVVNRGRLGIDCIESGGPSPGQGCGGRGVARVIEFLDDLEVFEDDDYDTIMFDVLGDVVCGGFAAPLRKGCARKVCIVVNEEAQALFAANNITKAIHTYAENGVCLAGLIANYRTPKESDRQRVEEFAELLNTRVLAVLERSELIAISDRNSRTVIEDFPDSDVADAFALIAEEIAVMDPDEIELPTTLDDSEVFDFVME
jgi:nitrogenase iron protein NifH